ncbi:nucleotidyl transferase AbiEii/AbiGii toxin family protein [Zunongwangia sp. F363]|uniref:Nucleotidyl transferase AbiEii/AbiGii toxin family protein n=1 Tax=Autumnicola tepida TaxID=3075595 RepID=A0ABU3CAS1_9FLAO|nr:nucleotidyl transferase AbiEii/AbiGii toxin family protein [Zunongwangia sp. F363]MDT0643446.1 nucleotidyl transferase AbiEii/AbiGii toxin family protein [Zunongwangia sp. F363]
MLHYNSINKLLHESLLKLMVVEEFRDFRLVGGTALSLKIGHRKSIDIDLFTDADYGSIDFDKITAYLKANFQHVDYLAIPPAMGKSFIIGEDENNYIKLDVFYTDEFIQPPFMEDTIRMASTEEIIAMKVDVVQRGGRKKDFWDLHALFASYSLDQMLQLHEKRYPYSHDKEAILQNFINFTEADDDFDPICLLGKYWEFIKDDIEQIIYAYRSTSR